MTKSNFAPGKSLVQRLKSAESRRKAEAKGGTSMATSISGAVANSRAAEAARRASAGSRILVCDGCHEPIPGAIHKVRRGYLALAAAFQSWAFTSKFATAISR
jgi:hypothetical protein